ncbi:MAG: TIR domain-containing protein [Dermatophilaceae bacterium]
MSSFFVSYTRADSARIAKLVRGLQKLRHRVWIDQELDGGQAWWDEVLSQIRAADAVVLCVTPNVLESIACSREVDYAEQLGKPVLPIMVQKTSPELLPPDLGRLQIVDFTEDNEDSAFSLVAALNKLPQCPPLPDPLPEPPPVPISYLSGLGQQIQAPALTREEQFSLIGQLRVALQSPDEREAVVLLMQRLHARKDLYADPSRELDELFAEAARVPPAGPGQPLPGQDVPPTQPQPTTWTQPAYPPQRPPKAKGGPGWKTAVAIGVGVLVVGAGAGAAYLAVTGSPGRPEPTPGPTTLTASVPPVGDACLVGSWVSTASSGNVDIVQKTFVVSGGSGAALAIGRDGKAELDYSDADSFLLTATDGTRLGMDLNRTLTSQLRASTDGALRETLITNQLVITLFDASSSQDVTSQSQWSPWTHYECSPSALKLSDAHQSMTFARP